MIRYAVPRGVYHGMRWGDCIHFESCKAHKGAREYGDYCLYSISRFERKAS